eukprot:2168879-Amphidinium_carterae.1
MNKDYVASISSAASSRQSTVDRPIAVSQQCSPIFLGVLQHSWYIETDKGARNTLQTIDRDSFIPTNCDNDTMQYLWWSWFTDAHLAQFQADGTVAAYKETCGDNVHKHHSVNLAIHCRWNNRDNDNYARNIRRASTNNGATSASIYYPRAEDVSIDFVPDFNGQEPVNRNLLQLMGNPLGVWNMDDWHRIDNSAQTILWMDHSISAWARTTWRPMGQSSHNT